MSDLVLHTDVPSDFEQQMRMANVLAGSDLLPGHLRRRPENVLVIMQGARALNIPAFWAFQSMFVVDGRLSMSADLMKALVLAAGHQFRVVERSATRAIVEIKRKDRDQPYRAEFNWNDAQVAKLTNKDNWMKYPKAMLVARAASIATRDECPEVLFGVLYTPDELGAVTDDEGVPTDDGRTIEMPDPGRVESYAIDIGNSTLELFPGLWKEIVDLGWALEKILGSDLSLADAAVDHLYVLAAQDGTSAGIRAVWPIAKQTGLIGLELPRDGGGRLGDHLLKMAKTIKDAEAEAAREQAIKDSAVQGAEDLKARMAAADQRATEIATARLQANVAASWGDGPVDAEVVGDGGE